MSHLSRRGFFGALATTVAAPVVPRRVYSFLWNGPLVVRVTRIHDVLYIDEVSQVTPAVFRAYMKNFNFGVAYGMSPKKVRSLLQDRLACSQLSMEVF